MHHLKITVDEELWWTVSNHAAFAVWAQTMLRLWWGNVAQNASIHHRLLLFEVF